MMIVLWHELRGAKQVAGVARGHRPLIHPAQGLRRHAFEIAGLVGLIDGVTHSGYRGGDLRGISNKTYNNQSYFTYIWCVGRTQHFVQPV